MKHGLNVDSKDRNGSTALQIAMAENHVNMVNLLVMNGANVAETDLHNFSPEALKAMLERREIGHRIAVQENPAHEMAIKKHEGGPECGKSVVAMGGHQRVSIYRRNPLSRRENCNMDAGRLIKMPDSMDELRNIAGTTGSCVSKLTCTYT